ncbi:MAG: dihydroorotase, multifunctional complex type [Devosia sp.]|jgi:allantoinase|nr:dihydroorotase, multifunctional complex type [Devosia sp.]
MNRNSLVRGGTVVTPTRSFRADILVRDGVIAAIGTDLTPDQESTVIDATGLHVMPGVIDPHSHLWESGFMSGPDFRDSTASAVAGGITTIVEMPLTTPEVLDVEVFRQKAALGEATSYVDFALYGGVRPSNLGDLEAMWEAGAVAFKIFTCDTGCAMHGVIDDADLLAALETIAGFRGLAGFHAENNELMVANRARIDRDGRTDNAAFNEWRNETVELEAINRILFYAGRTGARVNIVHVTSPNGVAMVADARARGVDATAETCPHYLYLTDKDIEERGAWVTCSPPMRGADAMAGMRSLINSGAIQTVGSDHGPVDPALKRRGHNNIFEGQPGMPANETMVPLMLNLVASGELGLERMAELTSEAPARLYGLYPKKGAIEIGSDADFTIVDIGRSWTISADNLIGKTGWTPFEGVPVVGAVAKTVIRGAVIAEAGRPVGEPAGARFVPRQ